jgi:hypothetical protein
MPPAAEESRPPPVIPNYPEDAEGEESDDYDVEVGSDSCGFFLPLVNVVLYRMMINTMKMRTRTRKTVMKPNRTV